VYFQDLTPYEYFEGEPPALNVGWLDAAHQFASGSVPDGLISSLRNLARHPVNQTRGFHVCPFCQFVPAVVESNQAALIAQFEQRQDAGALSSAEMRVVGRDGTAYAAPLHICHYIEKHDYQPPSEFIRAVMEV